MTANPTITWPSNTTDVIDKIRDTIGRDIVIYVDVQGIPCPVSGCNLDPVTQLSTNQFCEACDGNYWINTTSGITTKAHITWKDADVPEWNSGGRVIDGDCLVQIKYTTVLASAVKNSDHFIVDGKKLVKGHDNFRGVQALNRILVTLEQEEE